MTRAEKVAEAQRLQAEGLTRDEIAVRMGVARSTAGTWLDDPDLSKQRARRERYGRRCVECGAKTDGSSGAAKAPERCLDCIRAEAADRHVRIFAAWERGETAAEIARREDSTEGSILTLIDTARRERGVALSLHRRRNRELWPLLKRRWNEGVPVREIAAEAGISQENAYFMLSAMRKAGIVLPERAVGGRRKAAA